MPALIPTSVTGRVVWLGCQPDPMEKLVIRSVPLTEMPLSFAGYVGESHAWLTRPSCSTTSRSTTCACWTNAASLPPCANSSTAFGRMAGVDALLVPTAVWTHLRLPKMRTFIEFITVLPYMIPAIALVAGIVIVKPHARWFLNSNYALIPFYVVLALPFTYRSIDAGLRAIDLRTLVDASRSLGAGWGATLRKVLIPNLRAAIISAAFLTAAVWVLRGYVWPTLSNVEVGPLQALLDDALYLGLRQNRVRGGEYMAFVDEFVTEIGRAHV